MLSGNKNAFFLASANEMLGKSFDEIKKNIDNLAQKIRDSFKKVTSGANLFWIPHDPDAINKKSTTLNPLEKTNKEEDFETKWEKALQALSDFKTQLATFNNITLKGDANLTKYIDFLQKDIETCNIHAITRGLGREKNLKSLQQTFDLFETYFSSAISDYMLKLVGSYKEILCPPEPAAIVVAAPKRRCNIL